MAKTSLIESGVLVRMRPDRYHRDSATGQTYYGPTGVPGSKAFDAGSDPFRISQAAFAADEGHAENDKMFEKVAD